MQREHSKSDTLSDSPRHGWVHFAAAVSSLLSSRKREDNHPFKYRKLNFAF